MDNSTVKIKTIEDGIMPKRGNPGDAGYDVFAREEVVLTEFSPQALIKVGFAVELPEDMVLEVCSRSGLAHKSGVQVLNAPGIVDSGYRNEVGVILFLANPKKGAFTVNKGDRIAQVLFKKVEHPELVEMEDLSDSVRGLGGFGSTGRN